MGISQNNFTMLMEVHPFDNFLYVSGTGVQCYKFHKKFPKKNFKTRAIRQKWNFESCVWTDEGFHENPLD